jgi:hypothetical protein
MNKEELRMSFLAGLITEGEYKQKLQEKQDLNENVVGIGAINNPFPTREKSDYELAFEHFTRGEVNEEDSMGKIGKQYAAPSTPTPIKNIQRIISDVDRKKVFLGKSNDPEYQNKMMIYFDDNDPFYNPLKKYIESEDSEYSKDAVPCLTRLSTMYPFLQPISQNPNVTPLKLDLINLNGLLAGLRSIITLRKCPDYMNDEDGQYILIELEELQGYISLGNVGGGLRKGTNYDLGKGFIFTTVDFD